MTSTNMKPISIERGWEVYNEMVGDRKFVSELHEQMVKINYWRGKGYDYKDGEVIRDLIEKSKSMTKQEQKEAARKAYRAIEVPALEAYKAELKRINNEPDEDIIEVDGKRYQLIK